MALPLKGIPAASASADEGGDLWYQQRRDPNSGTYLIKEYYPVEGPGVAVGYSPYHKGPG